MFRSLIYKHFEIVKNSKEAIFHGVSLGLIVGVSIVFYNFITTLITNQFKLLPFHYWCFIPLLGFLITHLFIRLGKITNTTMADEIVESYHVGIHTIKPRSSFFKLLASIFSIAGGSSAGLEGGSKWLGGVLGVFYNRYLLNLPFLENFKQDPNTTMMSGAAAGISAIFKAPLSGTILALESPYKKDFAHDPLIQAFICSAVSYAVTTAFFGTDKFFNINFDYHLHYKDFLFCFILGILAGIYSSTVLKLNRKIKENIFNSRLFYPYRYLLGGLLLSTIAYVGFQLTHENVSLFAGYDIITDIFKNKYDYQLIALIFILRTLAFIVTFSFGGVGGQFVSSATLGACIGYLLQYSCGLDMPIVYSFIGMSAFITASYNGLLFGPVLIAEITGQPSLVVLGILASTTSFLLSNGVSNSQFQKEHR